MAHSRTVLMTGSLGFPTVDEVFEEVPRIVGPAAKRIPDGEPGERNNWVAWQVATFEQTSSLALLEPASPAGTEYRAVASYVVKDGVAPADVEFPPLGYARVALASWEKFAQKKRSGHIAEDVRFQVSLPTVLPLLTFILPKDQQAIEPALEAALLRELGEIADNVPHAELAVQWDVAAEIAMLETDLFDCFLAGDKQGIIERLGRLGNAVAEDVELGFHLCYGNLDHKHFKEPTDTGLLVEIANSVFDQVHRPVNWVHMPVPIDRDDDDYFAPLQGLKPPEGMDLYLGLLHLEDGLEGARRRMATASRYAGRFGVATECGMGGRTADWTKEMLRLYRQAAEA